MVILPAGFVAVKYPGYFWNIPEKRLYSLKVDGILKPMVMRKKFWSHPAGYVVSINGRRRYLSQEFLLTLEFPKQHQQIPRRFPDMTSMVKAVEMEKEMRA